MTRPRVYCNRDLYAGRWDRWLRRNERAVSMTVAAVLFAAWIAIIIFGAEFLRAITGG